MKISNKDCNIYLKWFFSAMFIFFCVDMAGCSQLQVITKQDKIDAIDSTIPNGVIIPVYYDSAYEIREAFGGNLNGTYQWLGSTCYIFVIRDSCVVGHEADHPWLGNWHGDRPNDECRA